MARRSLRFVWSLASVLIVSIAGMEASVVIAPPADFKAFSNRADLIVVGTYTGATERIWTQETRFKKVLTDMHFTITSVAKADSVHFQKAADSVDVTTDGTADNEFTKGLTRGQEYVLFLRWVEPFQTYGLSHGLAGAYKIVGGEAISLWPQTELAQRHGRLSQAQLLDMIKKSAN